MNPNVIAGLINNVYSDFDVFSFNNRLKLQKFTYILQHFFDLNIGYTFRWYTYGPYCLELTRDSFNVDFKSIPKLKFEDVEAQKKFDNFLGFYKDKSENFEWLELASSLHFLIKLGLSEEQAIKSVESKRADLKNKGPEIKKILEKLKEEKIL